MKMRTIVVGVLAISVLWCGQSFAKDNKGLTGAGATFPQPLYTKMFDVYYKETGIKVNYQGIGSGGGVKQVMAKTVDFGASDAYLSEKVMAEFGAPVVHIPTTAGAVSVIYNVPGVQNLRLTPEVLVGIYLGKVTKWNDTAIQKINPDAKLPDMSIVVVRRSDGSGTTAIFTDYLAKVRPEWAEKVGAGKAVNWPVGLGAKGNSGVAGYVKQLPGAIGYVELAYAMQNGLKYAAIRNKSGNYVEPTIESVESASDVALPDDMRVMLTDTDAPYGYPISGFTWIIVYKDLADGGLDREKAKLVAGLLDWMVTDGQQYCKPLHYAPLSKAARDKALRIIKSLTYNGESLL